jgi:long-chain acyl-CoA synthetase
VDLSYLLEKAARARCDQPAVAVGLETVRTYGELGQRVATMAARFRDRLNLRPQDRIAIAMRNCPEFLEVLLASWHSGMCAAPINAKLHPREIGFILQDSGARCCFATPELAETISPLRNDVESLDRIISTESPEYQRLASGDPAPRVGCEPTDAAWLFYTSGTTGQPKGAVLSHRNLMAMTTSYFADVDQIAPDDCIIHAAPMSHGSGLYSLPHLAMGAKHVIPVSGQFDAGEIFDLIAAHSGAAMFAAPTMVKRLVDEGNVGSSDAVNLKAIIYGGGNMYVADLKKAIDRFGYKLVQIYGQGESPMTITALSRAEHANTSHPFHEQRLASVGTPHSVVEVRVADQHDRPVPPGEIGEVLVRGDTVMSGYWNNPEASAQTLRGGWLHTGDLGSFDKDGFLTLKDRSKDLIISGGSNIYPREVEEVLLLHENVREAAVVGTPDEEWGEKVVAFVVSINNERPESELDRLCLDHIARFKRPKEYHFVDELPKNNYGKIVKTELRDRLGRNAP